MFAVQDTQSILAGLKNGEKLQLNLSEVLEDLFMVLSDKERQVVVERFGLDGKNKRTLEFIGRKFSITRERVRQIENVALKKLQRVQPNTDLKVINELARHILNEAGGVMLEETLVSKIILTLKNPDDIDGYIVKLSLNIDNSLSKKDKSLDYYPFWYDSTIPLEWIAHIVQSTVSILKAKGDVLEEDKLVQQVMHKVENKIPKASEELIVSCLTVDRKLKKTPKGWGLRSWRHICPRSIRDKAYIILKEAGEPLHFIELANRIINRKFDHKTVTVQATHNELIRDPQFVLVGRGLYALKEWGYEPGTVADVIESVLKKAGKPLTKQEIIQEVFKRRKVKTGTVSLNLQNYAQFKRVGRAVYTLDLSKKK